MATLELLNRKIKTAHDLLGVVRTMKSLAAVNIRQLERAVASLEQYRCVVERGWTVLLRLERPMGQQPRNGGDVCLVAGSDQGLCGQFNESLCPFVHEKVRDAGGSLRTWTFWSMGEKIHGILSDAGVSQDLHFRTPGSLSAVNDRVREVIRKVEQRRSAKKLESFTICHHVLAKQGGYHPVFRRILPLDASWADERRLERWPGRCLPMLGASRETMFAHLFGQYLFISFFGAFAQSLAAENAARLMAMQAAEKNILDLQEDLQARFREQRQTGITSEILDIVAGFEALGGEGAMT